VAWSKPQDRRPRGIQPGVAPLAARRRRASDRSFERLYRNHVHAVYRYALAVLHNEADAEDVTQTTFLNAYRAYERGERPHTPHNWLIKIAHNVCRQRFRDSSRRPREVELNDALTPATTQEADVPSADEIRRALGFLAFNQRAALVMRELEGRSYAEIAEVLGVSHGAVETLMFRARRALREQLEGGLTCSEAEQTLSRLETRKLAGAERKALRAHLRECKDCATLERRQRSQRAAFERLGLVPLPASLASFVGGGASGGAAAGGIGLGAKVAAVLAAGLVVTGVGHEPIKALATDNGTSAKPAAHVTPAVARTTTVRSHQNAGGTKAHRRAQKANARKTRSRESVGANNPAQPPATQPASPQPAPPPPSSGGAQQTAGGQPLLKVHLPLPPPPPPIQLPEVHVQLPPLPPPLELPPPLHLPPLPPPPPLLH